MSYRTFRIIEFVVVAVLVALTILAVDMGIAWLAISAAVIALVLLLVLRRGIREIVADERNASIASKAAGLTFQAGTLIMVLTGAAFGALSKSHPGLEPYATVLVCCGGGMMSIYILGMLYYSGKYGGGIER